MRRLIVCSIMMLSVVFISLWGCKPDPSLSEVVPDNTDSVYFFVPNGWPQPFYQLAANNNNLTQQGFKLGRKIFYDTRLSKDSTISCGSCHQPFAAFAHLDHNVSHGIYGLLGTRNSPGLFNMAWNTSYFWDGGVNNLENQPINPIQNHVEMDETIGEVVTRLNADPGYRAMFKSAFGDETINSQRIFKALAQFMSVLISDNSRYDKYVRGEQTLTQQELHGLTVFRQKCESCHKEPLFSDFSYRNNGLAVDPGYKDSGRAHITQNPDDLYKFKVPSLRNVALTRPYMHDGRFNTLEAVLDHYRNGIVQSATLDSALKNGIQMTDSEEADIIAFLQTLSDEGFANDKRFNEPN